MKRLMKSKDIFETTIYEMDHDLNDPYIGAFSFINNGDFN